MIYRIYQSNLAECILEKLFLQEHIREAAAPYFYEYLGRHQLYCSIEQGKTHVYGCFAGREFRGIILGRRLPDGYFYAHFFLLRGKDGWKFKNPAEEAIAADYEAEGIPLAGLMGCIPRTGRLEYEMFLINGKTDTLFTGEKSDGRVIIGNGHKKNIR